MSNILEEVKKKRAGRNTKYHILYGYYYQGLRKSRLAQYYGKSKQTVANWINIYNEFGFLPSKRRENHYKKFPKTQTDWIVNLFKRNPMLYLEEAKLIFQIQFLKSISTSSIGRILHSYGYTRKVLERRAMQIREDKILDFTEEINSIDWFWSSLCFLDEISVDKRGVWRKKGWSLKGKRLIRTTEFQRGTRNSLLCFLGQQGIQEAFDTDGTFTRKIFFDCCRRFVRSGKVQRYPGRHSIWILDNARIHCHPGIADYLRSVGIVPVFLPPYSPFYNPIEIIFGILKSRLRKIHQENGNLSQEIALVLNDLATFDSTELFKKCGYRANGNFDPTINYQE